jgi:hypothetical protein
MRFAEAKTQDVLGDKDDKDALVLEEKLPAKFPLSDTNVPFDGDFAHRARMLDDVWHKL